MAAYLRALDDADLAIAAVFLGGRPFPERDQRTAGLGWAAIVDRRPGGRRGGGWAPCVRPTTARRTWAPPSASSSRSAGHGPPADGRRRRLARGGGRLRGPRGGPGQRGQAGRPRRAAGACRPAARARYLVAILGGELRIGLREGHLEAAIAAAFERDLAAVQWAGMLTGDIGRTAVLARHDALAERASWRSSIRSSRCSPRPSPTRPRCWPASARRSGWRTSTTASAPSCTRRARGAPLQPRPQRRHEPVPGGRAAAAPLPWDGILDGEILAWKDGVGAALPAAPVAPRSQGALGGHPGRGCRSSTWPSTSLALGARVRRRAASSRCCACRCASGAPAWRHSASTARPGFGLAALVDATDADELARIFAAAQARGNEGLMLKDPDSIYAPGRRGYAWLKLKKALTTLDCVVVGVEVGHGRRHGVLSDYTFAVLDDRPGAPEGALVTIGKAYSGLTDAEIAEMTRWFEAHTLSRHGRYRVVEPRVVVEIAFDVIHRSSRHASGYALRFPRIVRIRDDKGAAEIDRLSTVAVAPRAARRPAAATRRTGAAGP